MVTPGEVRRAKEKAVGGKRDRCRKGKSCSATCIAGIKLCLVNMQLSVSSAISKASSLITRIKRQENPDKVIVPEGGYKVRSKPPGRRESLAGKADIRKAFKGKKFKDQIQWLLDLSVSSLPTTPYKERREIAISQLKQSRKFAGLLERNLPSNIRAYVADHFVQMFVKTESGDRVLAQYSPRSGFHFMVNNTHDIGSVKTKEGRVQVALAVRSIYDSVIRSLPEGSVIRTRANTEDGMGDRRTEIYNKLGFSLPSVKGGDMYGIKGPGNVVSPSSREAHLRQSGNPESVYFSESTKDPIGTMEDWYQIVFGQKPNFRVSKNTIVS